MMRCTDTPYCSESPCIERNVRTAYYRGTPHTAVEPHTTGEPQTTGFPRILQGYLTHQYALSSLQDRGENNEEERDPVLQREPLCRKRGKW